MALALNPSEFITFRGRRHFWFLLKQLAVLAVFIIGVPALALITAPFLVSSFGPQAQPVLLASILVLFVVASLMALVATANWIGTTLTLTNQRVVSAVRELIWTRSDELPVCDIQDIFLGATGFGPILNFADVVVETASDSRLDHLFQGLANPALFDRLLNAQLAVCRKEGL